MEQNTYAIAWGLVLQKLETKTGWGRNELKDMMLKSFVEAGNQAPEVERHRPDPLEYRATRSHSEAT